MSNEMKMNELDKVAGGCFHERDYLFCHIEQNGSGCDIKDCSSKCDYMGYFNPNWGKRTGRVSGEASSNKRLGARTSVS